MKSIELKEISRMVFYLCTTAVCMFMINSCQLKEEVIEQCKDACDSFGNKLLEVSARSCECSGTGLHEEPKFWIR